MNDRAGLFDRIRASLHEAALVLGLADRRQAAGDA